MRSRGAGNKHISTQGKQGEIKERSIAEWQPEAREKQARGTNAETENIKKGLKPVFQLLAVMTT